MRKLLLMLTTLLVAGALLAQDNAGYKLPPKDIADMLLATPTPGVFVDHRGEWMLLAGLASYPSVSELAQPELRIAGLRFNPENYALSRQNFITGFTLKNLRTGKEYVLDGLPTPLHAGSISWSPTENKIAFINTTDKRVDLYVIDIPAHQVARINKTALNVLTGGAYRWVDDKTLIYKVAMAPPSAAPPKPLIPPGPTIQENLGRKAASATYEDLIKSPYDEALFTFYAQARLVKNTAGVEIPLGKPAIFVAINVSPDKKYVLLRTIHKPYSYLVTAGQFNATVAITDIDGRPVKTVTELPSGELAPRGFDNTLNAPRDFGWRDDMPSTLVWCVPLDSGMMNKHLEYHDAFYELPAPFNGDGRELFRTRLRFQGITWGNDSTALVNEGLNNKQKEILSRLDPHDGRMTQVLERNTTDSYNDPGRPVLMRNKYGEFVLQTVDNGSALLFNNTTGGSPKGDLPFLAKFDLTTGHSNILWRCPDDRLEMVTAVLDPVKLTVLTRRETPTERANYYLRDLSQNADGHAVTHFPNPYPQLDGTTHEKISYTRADGVALTGELYLPKGYDAHRDGPLPVVIWAYPREFNSAADAGQVRGSMHAFPFISWASPVFWVTRGYAILDNAEMPIVATDSTKKPNDDFIHQLTMNAEAAIRKLAEMGVGDSNRVAVGGHSYGAFMTVNLLAHTRLFRAGIARSGAYNRSLTPFGFQNEDRTYWEDPQLYFEMSPFSYADKIRTPLLMIHGEMDDNSGTFPIQSERLYNAIKGHGGTVRYVVLPYEAHGYRGRENLLHMLYEQDAWLEKYVKNAPPAGGAAVQKAF